jgi:hypothetical protein
LPEGWGSPRREDAVFDDDDDEEDLYDFMMR